MLEFEAPEVVEAIFQSGIVATHSQASSLFRELKKYLVLAALSPVVPMMSAVVDAAWHQFILHTEQYTQYCVRGCGAYLHHEPGKAESAALAARGAPASAAAISDFVGAYEGQFGPLPQIWQNEHCVRLETRVRRRDAREEFWIVKEGTSACLVRGVQEPQVVCRVNERAQEALAFIAAHAVFFVRELPGLRGDAERLSLVSSLLRYGIFRFDV